MYATLRFPLLLSLCLPRLGAVLRAGVFSFCLCDCVCSCCRTCFLSVWPSFDVAVFLGSTRKQKGGLVAVGWTSERYPSASARALALLWRRTASAAAAAAVVAAAAAAAAARESAVAYRQCAMIRTNLSGNRVPVLSLMSTSNAPHVSGPSSDTKPVKKCLLGFLRETVRFSFVVLKTWPTLLYVGISF